MAHVKVQPPWEFLLSASRTSLQSFELSRLSYASNLRKEIVALLDEWLEENAAAMLARWLLEQSERSARAPDAVASGDARDQKTHGVSDNIFADRAAPPPVTRGTP